MKTIAVAVLLGILAILGFSVFLLFFIRENAGESAVTFGLAFVAVAGVVVIVMTVLSVRDVVLARVMADTVAAQSGAFTQFMKGFGAWAGYMKQISKEPKGTLAPDEPEYDEWYVTDAPSHAQIGGGAPSPFGALSGPAGVGKQPQLPVWPDEAPAPPRQKSAEVIAR